MLFSQLNFTFIDNSALEATAIFMLSALQCSWIGNFPPYFDPGSVLKWPFVNVKYVKPCPLANYHIV